ncbi:hypothetical protein [Lacinutrix sp.]|uniref:hypothetical protein n=1 Tax=Lacinutrix sp. TaxID=1937692 RepID=UPI0025C62EA5|nr:hypothetical protein [Lacinutrix sp.]
MKHFLLLVLFIVSVTALNAQHTKSYIEFTNNFILVDTITIDTKFSNGLKKDSGTKLVYKYKDYVYEFLSGGYIQYDKKGNIITNSKFDNFGNYLSYKYYDSKGNLIEDSVFNTIDINTNNLEDFMANTYKNTVLFGYKKQYTFSNKLCLNYLKKEGKIESFKKIGVWKIYSETGELKKEKIYK